MMRVLISCFSVYFQEYLFVLAVKLVGRRFQVVQVRFQNREIKVVS